MFFSEWHEVLQSTPTHDQQQQQQQQRLCAQDSAVDQSAGNVAFQSTPIRLRTDDGSTPTSQCFHSDSNVVSRPWWCLSPVAAWL